MAQIHSNDSTKNGTYWNVLKDSVEVRGYFKDSKRHKVWTWYNKDGSRLKQSKYKHGIPRWTIYFENNKPWLKINRKGRQRVIKECDCRVIDY